MNSGMQSQAKRHQNFIDWMKAVGMFFIVFGHVVGPPFNQFTQPVNPKQLGVAFFVFIIGWSLANENRARGRVLFNRLFPVYLFGLGCAFFLSLLFLFLKNDTNPSNYLPFFLGINVFLNYFPANPTTWYIGTYLHLLLFWVFMLKGKKIQFKHLIVAMACEIVVRGLIMTSGKAFIAYMLLPNWLTIFLLGMFFSGQQDSNDSGKLFIYLPLWFGVFGGWAFVGNSIGFDTSFPFRNVLTDFPLATFFRSALISIIYVVHTLIFFAIARRLPPSPLVSFFARNTLIIFIGHMPIIYECSSFIYSFFETTLMKKSILIFLVYVGLAIFSELLHKVIDMKQMREQVWGALEGQIRKLGQMN